MAEFLALSAKVSEKTASEEERGRWRELRAELAAKAPPPPPIEPGQTPRAHDRAKHKLRVHFAPLPEMTLAFTDEVGGGGLRFRSQKPLEPGTRMVLHIEVASQSSTALTVEARVIWSRRE